MALLLWHIMRGDNACRGGGGGEEGPHLDLGRGRGTTEGARDKE